MSLEVFLMLLFAVSVFTGLFVEGIKKGMGDKYKLSSNVLAGVVSVTLSVLLSVAYCIFTNAVFNAQLIIILIALILLGWLCAMLGYDKVVQAIIQVTKK